MATRKKTGIFDKIQSFMPRFTRRNRRVAPISTEVSDLARLTEHIEKLQDSLKPIEELILEVTTKYYNKLAEARDAKNSGDEIRARVYVRFARTFKNNLKRLRGQQLKMVKSITEAEIEKIQKTLETVTSIEEQQALLNMIEADITRYRDNTRITRGETMSAKERGAIEIALQCFRLYKIYEHHLKSLEGQQLEVQKLINQKAPGSETAETQQDAITDIDDAMNNARIITNIMSGMPRESPELSIQEFSPEEEALWDEFQAEFQAELNGSTSKGGKKSRKHRTRRRHKKSRKYY